MATGRKSLIVASFVVAAGQVFAASTNAAKNIPAHRPTTPAKLAAPHAQLKHSAHRQFLPAGEVDLAKESYYAVLYENGREIATFKSDGLDATKKVPTASMEKMLTADAVLDKTGANISLSDWKLLKQALIHSDNEAITNLAMHVSSEHNEESVRAMLKDKISRLNLADQYDPINASGYPNRSDGNSRKYHDPKNKTRYDTYAAPAAILAVGVDLVMQHADKLEKLYCSATAEDGPTNNAYCPAREAGRNTVQVFGKTGTDFAPNSDGSPGGQNHSMEVFFKWGSKVLGVYHYHSWSDLRSPVSTMAAISAKLLKTETDIRDAAVFTLLNGDASGAIKPTDVRPLAIIEAENARVGAQKEKLALARLKPKAPPHHANTAVIAANMPITLRNH